MSRIEEGYFTQKSIVDFRSSQSMVTAKLIVVDPKGNEYSVPIAYFSGEMHRWSSKRGLEMGAWKDKIIKGCDAAKRWWRKIDYRDPKWVQWFDSDITDEDLIKELTK